LTSIFFFFLLIPPPPTSTLFPYTTLFRSRLLMFIGPRARLTVLLFLSLVLGANDQPKNTNQIARFTDIAQKAGLTMKNVFGGLRSEEHTSELQSRGHLVCRLLLEKKKKTR